MCGGLAERDDLAVWCVLIGWDGLIGRVSLFSSSKHERDVLLDPMPATGILPQGT